MPNTILHPSDFAAQSLACIYCYGEYHSLKSFEFYEVPHREIYLYFYMHNGSILLETSEETYLIETSNIAFLPYTPEIQLKSNGSTNLYFHILYLSGSIFPCFYKRYMAQALTPVLMPFSLNGFTSILSKLQSFKQVLLPKSEAYLSRLLVDLMADTIFARDIQYIHSDIPDYLVAIQKLFHEDLKANYTLDNLAHMFHVNKYKLIKEFKEYFLIPPMQYLLDLRIRKAKELLRLSDLKISQIAEKTGFSNTNYFIHLFKKKIGLSPTDFRNHQPSKLEKQ